MQLNKVSHVYTLARIAAELGEKEDHLLAVLINIKPEDGLIWVYGPGGEQCAAFTSDSTDYLRDQIALYKDNPDLLPTETAAALTGWVLISRSVSTSTWR